MPSEPRADLVARLALLSEQESTETALFHQAAGATMGIGITDVRALSIVLREGPQTAGAFAERLHITSGAVTGVIDRLVRAGFVRREKDPGDARRVVVVADAERVAQHNAPYVQIGEAFAELYAGYTDAELAFLARYLDEAALLTRQQTASLAAERALG